MKPMKLKFQTFIFQESHRKMKPTKLEILKLHFKIKELLK